MTRRELMRNLAAAGAGCALAAVTGNMTHAADGPCILLRSSWQTVNIGDIAHTPGVLRLLEEHLPDAQLMLWPCNIDRGVEPMLRAGFPRVQIVRGSLGNDGEPSTPELRTAFDRATLLLHGSGPSVVRAQDVEGWRRLTGKPYGIYGVTVSGVNDELRDLLSGARFVYCRDTISLETVRESGATPPVLEFAPDGAFGFHLRDEDRAAAYMAANGLEEGRFVAAIPRLRYTPYHEIHHREPTEEDLRRAVVTAEFQEADHAKLREALVLFVRETGLKVLACPEMIHEMRVAKESLVDPLPEDVKARVVWREDYWLPDEATSVYARALGVVSFEMHSPIMAAANGTPAVHLRQPTDTCKGQMWRDVGLSRWLFEIDETTGEDIAGPLVAFATDRDGSREYLASAMGFVRQRQEVTMRVVGEAAG